MREPDFQIAPGVAVAPLRTPTLPPATHTNCWILGDKDVVVVEPASPEPDEQNALSDLLAERGYRVRIIFLTHHHMDHIGGVEVLRQATGAPVAAHPETASRVPFSVDMLVHDGETIETDAGEWTAIHTPGHAPGHLCLHSTHSGCIVAGDMVAGEGTILLDPPEGHLGQYLESLALLKTLGPNALLPAHGPVLVDGPAYLQQYIDHRHMRTDQIKAALAQHGSMEPMQIVPHVYPDLNPAFHFIAARQITCHLQWIQEQ